MNALQEGKEMMTEPYQWWQSGIVYQIYPRSFMDSNGDGVGDLAGITGRLDYVRSLGVDAIWLSPIYPSPMADFGYDVANYTAVDPIFGDLADFDALVRAAHERGLKLLLDLVPNHTSDEHPWFVESRSSRDNPRRDWYIWRDPAPGGGPPNNWQSNFGGDAWYFDETTGQYYLHLYHYKQPDLNWRNAQVRKALYDAMRFWFDRGVDGFRIDVIWQMIKDAQFRDNPPNPEWQPGGAPGHRLIRYYTEDQPEVHQVIREMRALSNEYPDRVLIGEIYLPIPRLVAYYGTSLDEIHLPFNFQLLDASWQAQVIRQIVDAYEAALPRGGWPNWVLGNHDRPRIATRIGRPLARVAQMLLLTLRGTPTCYYGDELGMVNVPVPHERAFDPQEQLSPGYGRDPQRTPMQWDDSSHAGFSRIEPWLPVADDSRTVNVAVERDQPTSMLSLFRRLTALRRAHPALATGVYRAYDAGSPDILAYLREADGQRIAVVLNFSEQPCQVDSREMAVRGTILCSTLMDREGTVDLATLDVRRRVC